MKKLKAIIFVVLLIFIDQFSKYLVKINLKNNEPFVIIKKVFKLEYLENNGAAFGILKNHIVFFISITFIVIVAIGYLYCKLPDEKKYKPIRIILIFITAGALGNLIDRVSYNFVIDFLYFELINFPVFNIADCYVTVSAFVLIALFIFYYKDEDFNFLTRKPANTAISDTEVNKCNATVKLPLESKIREPEENKIAD